MNIDYCSICVKDLSLRDYQQKAKEKIFSHWNYVNDIMYQMPTGTGKTRLFTSIIRDINVWGLRTGKKQHILIIAHRSELIEQIDRSLNKYHVSHGIIAGGVFKEKRDLTQSVQVASIQTISHGSNYNLARNLNIDFIIIDEAHHAVAASYNKLWQLYPEAKKLGVTATPWRMNNRGFKSNFEVFIPSMSIRDFMQKGWLAPYKYYSIPFNSSLIKTIDEIKDFDIEGDYKVSALENIMDNDHIRAQLLNSYKQFALGKKGIIYSISRLHSEHICAQYRASGIQIVSIDSETPARKREMLVNDFKNGLIDIIVNVDIFSEGFDCPDIEFIQLARPTKSLVKYIQQVGRGLRKNGDKECIILDNVALYKSFGLPDEDWNWVGFFEGEESEVSVPVNSIPGNHSEEYERREKDLTEGDEVMVLVQDVALSELSKVNNLISKVETNVKENEDKEKDISEKPKSHKFSIQSRTFKGKYIIEENEDGYYIYNTRNNQKCYLGKYGTHFTGSIIVRKMNANSFMIIRVIPRIKGLKDKEIIIGSLVFDGGILKFSSFNKVIVNKNVSI